ncbi:MAG: hypothetical protein PVH68_21185 [Armatimonadota bacterium]|jgi:hypothetical protein
MSGAVATRSLRFTLVVAVLIAAAFPAHAQYTKYYEFPEVAGEVGLDATLFGYEYITDTYSNAWGDGAWGLGSLPYTTAITWGDGALDGTGDVAVGWTTWDMSCFLWDLRWDSGDPIMPDEAAGVPGGGYLTWDDRTATWTVCNSLWADPPEGAGGPPGDLEEMGVPQGYAPPTNVGPLPIYLPTSLNIAVLNQPWTPGQSGGEQNLDILGDLRVIDVPEQFQVLDPGECFPITIPDVQFGQTLLLTAPILDSEGDTVGHYAEAVTVTPEPCTLVLLACTGLPLLARLRRRPK